MGKYRITLAAIFIMVTILPYAAAYPMHRSCKDTGHSHAVGEGEVTNLKCPVTGVEVSRHTPYRAEYKDEKVGFCCPKCVHKFEADPKRCIGRLKKED